MERLLNIIEVLNKLNVVIDIIRVNFNFGVSIQGIDRLLSIRLVLFNYLFYFGCFSLGRLRFNLRLTSWPWGGGGLGRLGWLAWRVRVEFGLKKS